MTIPSDLLKSLTKPDWQEYFQDKKSHSAIKYYFKNVKQPEIPMWILETFKKQEQKPFLIKTEEIKLNKIEINLPKFELLIKKQHPVRKVVNTIQTKLSTLFNCCATERL